DAQEKRQPWIPFV
uniref:Peroniin-1.2a n=1 Tax=Litoria peronii TaxID=317363 RepID=PE12A_LITPE|nr:RecName: Full=Peroniin-1.2a [Litoria peronii]